MSPVENDPHAGSAPAAPDATRSLEATHVPLGGRSVELAALLAPPQEPGELGRLGPYRVLRVLGTGGMGVVFLAEDPELGRRVALKAVKPVLAADPSVQQRFQREAKASARVKHDHIITIYQVGQDRGIPYLAMEYLEGESLEDRLRRQEVLPIAEALHIAHELTQGLAAAHTAGLIHRDIKPGNIWLETKGKITRIKILDFGLARLGQTDVQVTQSGAIVGTPAYMAPEQASAREVDARCDLFSLGAVLYRMVTGRMAFPGGDLTSILASVLTLRPTSPRDLNPAVPPALSDLILRLLAKEPAGRPASAQAVLEELLALEDAPLPAAPPALPAIPVTTAAAPVPTVLTPRRPGDFAQALPAAVVMRGLWGWVTATALLLVGLVLGTLWLLNQGEPRSGAQPHNGGAQDESWVELFNGKDLAGWVTPAGAPANWTVRDGCLEVGSGNLLTRYSYGDCQLHVEFWLPLEANRSGQARANSGVFLQGRHEIQILDSHGQPPSREGCGALFGLIAPSQNASKPAEQWQTFEITFRAPRPGATGQAMVPGRLTVVHNGEAVIQDAPFTEATVGAADTRVGQPGPIVLQADGSPVRFRNLRIRPLSPR